MKMIVSLMALVFASMAYAAAPAGHYSCENPYEDSKFDIRVDTNGVIHFVKWTDGDDHQPEESDFSQSKLIQDGSSFVMTAANSPDTLQPNMTYEVSCVRK